MQAKDKQVLALFEGRDPDAVTAAVGYENISTGYRLYTISETAIRLGNKKGLNFKYNADSKCYIASSKKLIPIDGVLYYSLEAKHPTIAQQDRIERQYDKVEKMRAVIDEMHLEIQKEEDRLQAMLEENGVKLKPGAPEDVQILLRHLNTRLHQQVSFKKFLDQEAIRKLKNKVPALRKCFVEKTITFFDKNVAEALLPNLPTNVQRQVMQMRPIISLHEFKIDDPECRVCGGGLNKQDICNRCGHNQRKGNK